MEPEGVQRPHSHGPEQIYYILSGCGEMTVDEDAMEVAAGDCVFVPSGATHGLRNTGGETLQYFSAAAPSFADDQLRTLWPLTSLAQVATE